MAQEIPKIIHYCWFGQETFPSDFNSNIKSWISHNPDFLIRCWGNENLPMEYSYVKNAFSNKKWANLSNFMRLYLLVKYGGIYLDTDVVVLKPFKDLMANKCFLGIESCHDGNIILNNAILASVPGHFFITKCLYKLTDEFDGNEAANLSSPILTTGVYSSLSSDEKSTVKIYPSDFFYPSCWNSKDDVNITQNTVTIHQWNGSWHTEFDNLYHKNYKKAFTQFRKKVYSEKFNLPYIVKFIITFIKVVFKN